MEGLLATAMAHSPDFDPAVALGRIHSILSALIQHCKTRAAYLYTGCFTCELQIRSGGNACVPPVVPDYEAKAKLSQIWKIVQAMDVPDETLVSQILPPIVSEPNHLPLIKKAAEPFVIPDASQPLESITHLLSWTIITPFALYCGFNVCSNIFWKILPVATLIFQVAFFLYFVVFVLMFSAILCRIALPSC
jgi:hypothetical protein